MEVRDGWKEEDIEKERMKGDEDEEDRKIGVKRMKGGGSTEGWKRGKDERGERMEVRTEEGDGRGSPNKWCPPPLPDPPLPCSLPLSPTYIFYSR